jgi:DEAD/DEAH box helicase domain-containing protein
LSVPDPFAIQLPSIPPDKELASADPVSTPLLDSLLRAIRRQAEDGTLVHQQVIAPRPAHFADPAPPLPPPLLEALQAQGIRRLYSHQAEALAEARAGRNPLVVTGTASGKSLAYQLPVLETLLRDPGARALFVFPTKALEQDQLQALSAFLPYTPGITAAILDGDTPPARREQLKAQPPSILITNPDLLHLSFLPHHAAWKPLWERLRFIVLDELHTYKGIFGSHIAHVLRRARRVAAAYGAAPQLVACSATISNPRELAEALTGLPFRLVDRDGAPRQGKRFIFVNPKLSPYTEATRLLLASLRHGLKTIAFTKARKITELITMWAHQTDPGLQAYIKAYRAGYTPGERRAIERGLFEEDLQGVVSTSALELGIDVGGLDACILVGYPGSIASTWQRAGRVGRGGQEALVLLVALPDALDQYFMRHPDDFFARPPEAAVVDPQNRQLLKDHLVAAAAELPLSSAEAGLYGADLGPIIAELQAEGRLVQSAAGGEWYARRKHPAREINIRSTGQAFGIVDPAGKPIGSVDGFRALHECHPGAIYLHGARQFEVLALDLERRTIRARPTRVDYYTAALGEKETDILRVEERRRAPAHTARLGRLKVTERITGYDKRRIFGQDRIGTYPLDLPPHTFETQGLWIEIPDALARHVAGEGLHFMGGIHAAEHALIALFPLFALCDRADVGGISYPFHPQVGGPAIFVYDGYPGGIGLCRRCYGVLDELLAETLRLLDECPCEAGCPSCVHSPKCGSGNRPLDKAAARFVLAGLLGRLPLDLSAHDAGHRPRLSSPSPQPPGPGPRRAGPRILILDLETQRSAEEVGGWDRADRLGLAAAVTVDLEGTDWRVYREAEVRALAAELRAADRVVGFNLKRFDYAVLRGYGEDLADVPTLDLLEEVQARLGFRLSLGHLVQETLGQAKLADGLQCLAWYKAGLLDKVIEYCRADVDLTRRLLTFALDQGYLIYRDHAGRPVRLPLDLRENLFPAKGQ